MEISRLRNTLKKLRSIEFDRSVMPHVAVAAQEMLDFLAMLEGVKPVYLLGRGLDDPKWVEGVKKIADDLGLKVIKGRGWITEGDLSARPSWYQEMQQSDDEDKTEYYYVCKAQAVAARVSL